uniref:NADH-ubiquinone oxidoreductase chain 2 n=1 Tax=Thalassa montezumae TaxID=3129753 RepID=A0AAU7LK55_9CUCU
MMFLITLMTGTLITISSFSWLSMWIGLELNLLSFIPLMSKKKNPLSSEASLKYFIIQAISSMIILFSIILIFISKEQMELILSPMKLILNSALLTKLGSAPFHFWFPEIIEGLSWFNTFLLLTWQKIAPLIMISYNFFSFWYFSLIVILCMVTSGVSIWNQISMKKILVFSSINHIGWMLSMMFFNQSLWMLYFLIYLILTFSLILVLNQFNIFFIQQLFLILNLSKEFKLFFFLNFFSLGGLPPFIGFFPKWITLMTLIKHSYLFLAIFMIFFTLITLFIYIRLTFQSLNLNFSEMKSKFSNSSIYLLYSLNFFNLAGLFMFTIIFNL